MHAVCMQYARSMYALPIDSTTRRLNDPSTRQSVYIIRTRVYTCRILRATRARWYFLGPYVITRSGIFSLGPGIFSVISRSARVIFLLVAPEAGLRRVLFLLYTNSRQYVCSVYAVCTQYVCSMYAVCTQYVCSMYAVCTQYVCSMQYARNICMLTFFTLLTIFLFPVGS